MDKAEAVPVPGELPYAFADTCRVTADRLSREIESSMMENANPRSAFALLAEAWVVVARAAAVVRGLCDELNDRPVALPPGAARAAAAKKTGCASGRHSYADGAAACSKCGKVKSAGGRPRKEPAPEPAPTAETRTVPLPLVGDAAADRFAGGGLGSSGVRR